MSEAARLNRVTAVTVNYRTPELAEKCVRALFAQRGTRYDLDMVLVDNGSGDGSAETLAANLADLIADGFVTFLPLDLNGGFGWANNQAMIHAFARDQAPDAFFLLNPDCVPEPGALDALVEELEQHPTCGVAGSQLLDTDGSLAGSAFHFYTIASEFVRGLGLASVGRLLHVTPVLAPYGQGGEVGWVTGASCLLRVTALREVGLFDTGFFLYFEEVELMHRLGEAGWSARHVPESRVMHIGGASTGVRDKKEQVERAMPSYWFDSRKRFFALTRGRGYAKRASLAWLAGARIGRMLAPIIPGDRVAPTKLDDAALRARGVTSRAGDAVPAITQISEKFGMPPRWMDEAR